MMRPVKPDSSDCCGSGCSPCVFDVFEAELEKWERGESHNEEGPKRRNDLLSTVRYLPFKIISIANVTPDVYLYRFQPSLSCEKSSGTYDSIGGELDYKPSQHFIMRCPQTKTGIGDKSRSEQSYRLENKMGDEETLKTDLKAIETSKNLFVSRAYTPISLASEQKNCCFDMIIKLYSSGAMSSLLRDVTPGDVIHFRGPYGGFELSPDSYSSLTMICAGTGIAPMISIIKSIIRDEEDETLILLLFTVSNFQNIILREDIQHFCRNWNVRAKIYLSNEPRWDEICKYIRHDEIIINQKITHQVIKSEVHCQKNNQILICGPSGFCEQVKSWLLLSEDDDIQQNIFIF